MGFFQRTVLTLTILFLSNTPIQCQKRRARANPMVSSLLKNLVTSPSNNDGALQLLRMAAARNRANPVLAEEIVVPNGIRPRSILPTNAITQSNACLQSNGIINNVMTQNPKLVPQLVLDYPQIERRTVPVQQIEVARSVPVTSPMVLERGPCPGPLVNPFLPAASPVSALAPPVSNLLPPANINNPKCTFLRKIPIPPPSL